MTTTKKVIELVRVSTSAQAADDRASIPAQHEVNRRTCQIYGLEIVKSFEIIDVSGTQVLHTPEMRELREMIKSPEIHGVVAREFSRLMRTENYEFALLCELAESDTLLYLADGKIDVRETNGYMLAGLRGLFAGAERKEMLGRIASAKEAKRRRGELGQSKIVLPFGVAYLEGSFSYKPEAERVLQAFRRFLAGEQSYSRLAKAVGVTPRGMHIIMRNPIWTGWRVIDKKRDPSAAGRYPTRDGRQGDRRKIARSPEDVIRVKVIEKPLISQQDFEAVQRIMDRKQARHWRSSGRERRFTYNGFLTCSACGKVIHTALARRDYYACKGRRSDHVCKTSYMGREELESKLDDLLTKNLTNPRFLQDCVAAVRQREDRADHKTTLRRLESEVKRQRDRLKRLTDLYVDGALGKAEHGQRLARIESDLRSAQELLAQAKPVPELNISRLINLLAPLAEWRYWSRDQKRVVLSALLPDIRVADYEVESLGFSPALFSNENTRTGRDSSPPPA